MLPEHFELLKTVEIFIMIFENYRYEFFIFRAYNSKNDFFDFFILIFNEHFRFSRKFLKFPETINKVIDYILGFIHEVKDYIEDVIDFLDFIKDKIDELLDYIETYLTPRRRGLFDKVISERTNYFTVATEDVYQLHNTSAVIRSCDVFGVQNVHIIEERNLRKIDREIAMGAQKWVNVNRYHTVSDSIRALREKGYQIVATTPHNNACMLDDFDISRPAAIFFGTEKMSDRNLRED